MPFVVTTDDPEDGSATVCSRVSWTFGLGHDAHAHPLSQGTGCQFAIPTPADATEHGETENIFGVVVIRYTDAWCQRVAPATSERSLILNPKSQEAEWADDSEGVELTARRLGERPAQGHLVRPRRPPRLGPGEPRRHHGRHGTASGSARWPCGGTHPTRRPSDDRGRQRRLVGHGGEPVVRSRRAPASCTSRPSGGVVLDWLTFVGNGVADVTPPTVVAVLDAGRAQRWRLHVPPTSVRR